MKQENVESEKKVYAGELTETLGSSYFNSVFEGLEIRIPKQRDYVTELRRIADVIERRAGGEGR